MLLALLLSLVLQAGRAAIVCTVTAAGVPVDDAEVIVAGQSYRTDSQGHVRIEVVPGTVELTTLKTGFAPLTAAITVASGGEPQAVSIELEALPSVQETVTVSATRTERGIEDQPLRVEVLDREEIDEKLLMTPGDVVMMLNEMGGMRAQATSPSLGAASVRIQGMRGRYTRFLSDGLPLFGEQVSLSLMQIPPLDLDHVEVIKGIASSLYGSGALAGVVNLTSRRPGAKTERQLLVNRSSRGATDAVGWYATPLTDRWGLTVIASANGQSRSDINGDTWSDTPRYERAVARPRLYWDNHQGRTFFATAGGTWEDRIGGSMPGTLLPAGRSYHEGLNTRRADVGASFQTVSRLGIVWTARGSWTRQSQTHQFGDTIERDTRGNGFGELTGRRTLGRHTWVGGVAVDRDRFSPRDVPSRAYTYTVPSVFVQDDVDVGRWLVLSGSARYDHHSQFGGFVSPRASGLLRHGPWSGRVSYGTGFFAPTPITEETDAAGLSRLAVPAPLKAERGRSVSADITRTHGPVSATVTLFHSRISDPVEVERAEGFQLSNLSAPTTNSGLELLGIWKTDDFSLVGNYAYVRSRETVDERRVDVPLTPRQTVGLDAAWEWSAYRLGIEWFYTGRQRLEANPYRDASRPYSVFGALFTRRVGRALLFVNGENLTDVRQTRWDPLLRPTRGVDGRWTVDGWAPLDGRNINGGIRLTF